MGEEYNINTPGTERARARREEGLVSNSNSNSRASEYHRLRTKHPDTTIIEHAPSKKSAPLELGMIIAETLENLHSTRGSI